MPAVAAAAALILELRGFDIARLLKLMCYCCDRSSGGFVQLPQLRQFPQNR
jgi:hypothetical protein